MKCPVCPGIDLVMAERQGVEIDYCPSCRGIWLDRGEMDKIVERSMTQGLGSRPDSDREPDSDRLDRHGGGHRRKKSWLSDIFD